MSHVCLWLVDVFHENQPNFQHISLCFQVKAMIHVAVNLLRFTVSPEWWSRILIILIQANFSGFPALAVPFCLLISIYLSFHLDKVLFWALSPGMDSHRLQEDLPIFDQLLDLLMGADICGFISLLESNQTSFFSTVDDTGVSLF